MRYHCDGYTEEYLSGGEINVAYNPDDVTIVWALIGGQYVAFDLVERRYNGKNVEEAQIYSGIARKRLYWAKIERVRKPRLILHVI